jgi:transcription elongation factor Elf1
MMAKKQTWIDDVAHPVTGQVMHLLRVDCPACEAENTLLCVVNGEVHVDAELRCTVCGAALPGKADKAAAIARYTAPEEVDVEEAAVPDREQQPEPGEGD